jgi:hypothetical protein
MRSKTGVNLLQKAVQADVNGDHKKARELEAEANIYLTPADKVEMGAGNESLPQQTSGIEGYNARQIKDTLKKPCQVSIDASQVRMELMQRVGVLELGLDAAESIGAENSFERMLAHQAVTCHKTALQLFAQSEEYRATGKKPEKVERLHIEAQTRYINTACRLMDTFQRTMTSIQKLRTGGQQIVTVQHVQINNAGDNSQTLITGEGANDEDQK